MVEILAEKGRRMKWKPNWPQTEEHFRQWWAGTGMVLGIGAPRDGQPLEGLVEPTPPAELERRWLDPDYRVRAGEWRMARQFYGGDAVPLLDTMIGPGSLGMFLGAVPRFAPTTVWYDPCIDDPDAAPPIRFHPENPWFRAHMDIIERGLARSQGRYLVAMPDLIENVDTLAALRGTEPLLVDMLERPEWVGQRVRQINQAFFEAFDLLYDRLRDDDGGMAFCAFALWGPGKTAKVQCDFSAMISPEMFRGFVQPSLAEQCEWLDYAMYHLDGPTCLQHLDALLEIEPLQAIEWTPQAGIEGGGHPRWYELYRRIRRAGKGVQAVGVQAAEVIPLLDAVGPQGLYILASAPDQATAEKIRQQAEAYR